MKKYFITGLLVLTPIVVTFWVMSTLVSFLDQSLLLLPEEWRPQKLLGFSMVGLGALLTLGVVFLTGVIATNFFGQQIIKIWEEILSRVPVVKSIYSSVKQVSDTIFSDSSNSFRQALLIEFPRKGSWTVAFLTGEPGGDVANHLKGDYVSVYVPTTPNPTGGYFLMMPKSDVVPLDMTVDQALKYIISMGSVIPEIKSEKIKAQKEKQQAKLK